MALPAVSVLAFDVSGTVVDWHASLVRELAHLNRAWHRLDPWPDSVAGLARLSAALP